MFLAFKWLKTTFGVHLVSCSFPRVDDAFINQLAEFTEMVSKPRLVFRPAYFHQVFQKSASGRLCHLCLGGGREWENLVFYKLLGNCWQPHRKTRVGSECRWVTSNWNFNRAVILPFLGVATVRIWLLSGKNSLKGNSLAWQRSRSLKWTVLSSATSAASTRWVPMDENTSGGADRVWSWNVVSLSQPR